MCLEMKIVRDFCQGIAHVKTAGYLIRFPVEQRNHYDYRLKQSILFNDTERTKASLVGRVFCKEPTLRDSVPVEIRGIEAVEGAAKTEGWAENVDLQGAHWTVFAKQVLDDAIGDGHSFIYVDMPPAVTRVDGEPATLADEQSAGHRPFFVRRTKDQAINWAVEIINGKPELAQITFKEITCERDGLYGEKQVTRYRVLRPGSWELYKEVDDGKGKLAIIPDGNGETSLSYIPVRAVYGGRQAGFLESFPPLEPLAQIECSAYNLRSDYRIGIYMTRPSVTVIDGNSSNKLETTGWYIVRYVNAGGDVKYSESSGNGLAYYEKELAALDQRMATFGLTLLARPDQAAKTATEVNSSDLKTDSPLMSAATSLRDSLEACFGIMADYIKLGSGGSVSLPVLEAEATPLTAQELQALEQAVAGGTLDRQTFLEIFKERGPAPENFDIEQVLARLKEAEDAAAERQGKMFDAGGLPGVGG